MSLRRYAAPSATLWTMARSRVPPLSNRVGPISVPLEILLDPRRLHVIAPVADIPRAPGAEATQLVRAAVHGNMDHRQAIVRVRGFQRGAQRDRKSTRLNSSHLGISYAVFCLK